MAKERLINTRFWNDSWVREINPLDRYLYLYLLTNEYTNISGIYELPLKTIAYGSGMDERDLKQVMLPRLEPKVFYKEGWIIIINFPKYQRVGSESVVTGIKRELETVPKSILEFAKERGYGDGLGIIPPSSHILNLTKLNLNNDFLTDVRKSSFNQESTESEDITVIEVDEDGTPIKAKKKSGGNKQSQEVKNIWGLWVTMCKKELGVVPEGGVKAYMAISSALNKLSTEEVKDLIDDWFSLGKPDEETIHITRALSTYQINNYKVKTQ